MTMKDINQRIKCWLEPKGFKQASPKSLFIKDQGFYFIVASLTPHKALSGFFFDLAVKFLWSSHEDISYDYTVGNSRVYGQEDPNPTLGGILYNSESLESELAYMMKEADKRIDAYMALADCTVLLKCLENRNDFVSVVNKGFAKRDKSKAIALVLCDHAQEAQEIFFNDSQYDSVSERLSKSCLTYDEFVRDLLDVINRLRRRLEMKLKIKLDDIDEQVLRRN